MSELAVKVQKEAAESQTPAPAVAQSEVADLQRRFKGIIGRSPKMLEVFKMVSKVAATDTTVLLNGETGTGKGLIARAIHDHSARRSKAFVQINCGAIPESLLESELFGHVRGAFTGATATKPGKFELARGGTIFLDEIGDMSPDLQVKILRVLEENEFEQVGGCKTIRADVRVVAATHRNLKEEVEQGRFREDLFYRLYVIPVTLCSLRERRSDIPLLVEHFLRMFAGDSAAAPKRMSPAAMEMLKGYAWPGNVRELKNMIERVVVLHEGAEIQPRDLPVDIHQDPGVDGMPDIEISEEGICLNTAVSEFEKNLIAQSLEKSQWVKNKAARLLKLKRTTLVEKIKRYELQPEAH